MRLWRRAPADSPPGCPGFGRFFVYQLRVRPSPVCSRKRLHPQIPSQSAAMQKERHSQRVPFFLVEATRFELTTSWSRTASRQGAHGVAACGATQCHACRSFSRKNALPFYGSPMKSARLVEGRKRESKPYQQNKTSTCGVPVLFWSRRRDLNSRPLGPEPSALPSCATPRLLIL